MPRDHLSPSLVEEMANDARDRRMDEFEGLVSELRQQLQNADQTLQWIEAMGCKGISFRAERFDGKFQTYGENLSTLRESLATWAGAEFDSDEVAS